MSRIHLVAMCGALALLLLIPIYYFSPGTSPEKDTGMVQVVAAPGTRAEALTADHTPPAASTPLSHAPEDDVASLIARSFPTLHDVATQCDVSQCDVTATTAVPQDDAGILVYEKMVREDIEAALQAHGHRSDGVQIEELGGDEARLRLRIIS